MQWLKKLVWPCHLNRVHYRIPVTYSYWVKVKTHCFFINFTCEQIERVFWWKIQLMLNYANIASYAILQVNSSLNYLNYSTRQFYNKVDFINLIRKMAASVSLISTRRVKGAHFFIDKFLAKYLILLQFCHWLFAPNIRALKISH